MNKTIYVADPLLWRQFSDLAHSRQLSVSAELTRLMREDLAAADLLRLAAVPPVTNVHACRADEGIRITDLPKWIDRKPVTNKFNAEKASGC